MTFTELQAKIGTQNKDDWHQHANGGGWVHKNAKIDVSAFIDGRAVIFSGKVYGDARVSGNAWVYGDAQVSGNAWVYDDAWVYGDAQVSGNAWVYDDAWVYGDKWKKSPLFVIGSRHSLTNAKHGHIQIGCHCKSIKWWAENYKDIGKKEGYSEEEIAEYGEYIKLFQKIGK